MKHFTLLCACLLSCTLFSQQAYNIAAPYDPATVKLAEELRGEIIRFDMNNSQRYPGTTREILVYVPQQYKDTAPACLLVCMDGILYDATTVLDNLIATGEMPVTIGVFINPGVVYDEDNNVVRYNRCKEFDSTDDTWAQFIEQEVLPQVTALKTTDGRSISISADPNDRAITGASSGLFFYKLSKNKNKIATTMQKHGFKPLGNSFTSGIHALPNQMMQKLEGAKSTLKTTLKNNQKTETKQRPQAWLQHAQKSNT